MTQNYESINEGMGMKEGVSVNKGTVYKVIDTNGSLVTTSGQLNVLTLSATIAAVVTNFPTRFEDWVLTLDGVVVSTLHIDNSITTP
jgi:hypothetical protein